jgi:MFS family permease
MDAHVLKRSLKLSVIEGALATSMGSLLAPVGVVITGFALALGASGLQIGLLAALATLANLAQLAGSIVLERWTQRKGLCVGAQWAGRLLWLLVPLAAILTASHQRGWLIYALLAVVGLSHAMFAVGGVAWLSWIKDLVPADKRVGFLALRNQFDVFLSLSLGIAGALFLDGWQKSFPGSIDGFVIVIVAAVAVGLAGVPLLSAIPDAGMTRSPAVPIREVFRRPLADTNFRRLIQFYSCWNLAANIATPFFAVYMLQRLQLPFWHVTALLTLGSLAGLVASRFWARMSVRFGVKPIVLVASLVDCLFPLCWVLIEPQSAWLLPLVYLLGVANSPVAIGANNLLLKTVPDQRASSYIAVFNSIVGPITALAAVLGGVISQSFADWTWTAGPIELGGLKIVFLLSFLGRLASLTLLGRVAEPHSISVSRLVRLLARAKRRSARKSIPAGPLGLPAPLDGRIGLDSVGLSHVASTGPGPAYRAYSSVSSS